MLTSRKDLHMPNLVPPVVGYILEEKMVPFFVLFFVCRQICFVYFYHKVNISLFLQLIPCFLCHVVEDAQTLRKKSQEWREQE